MAINVSGHCNGAAITSAAKTFSDLSVTVPSGAACFIGRVETECFILTCIKRCSIEWKIL